MTTTTIAYRDSVEGASLRYADLLARAGGPRLRGASSVLAKRTGRIWAGATGLVGACFLAASTILDATGKRPAELTKSLLVAWPSMGIAYVLGRGVGALRAASIAAPRRTANVLSDLARLEANEPTSLALRAAAGQEWASIALPMMAFALLAPLTIHFVVYLCRDPTADFDTWIRMSLLIVGHAHVALAVMCTRFASRAGKLDSAGLERARSSLEWSAWGVTVVVSAIPGIVLFLLPPAITAGTGLLFNPLMFRWMTRTVIAERTKLGEA